MFVKVTTIAIATCLKFVFAFAKLHGDDGLVRRKMQTAEAIQAASCDDLNDEFMLPGTVYCAMVLGIGVMNGSCEYISGCDEMGHVFFGTIDECILACGNDSAQAQILPVQNENTYNP